MFNIPIFIYVAAFLYVFIKYEKPYFFMKQPASQVD